MTLKPTTTIASTMSAIPQSIWRTDELALRTMAFLPPHDLRNCAQVSQSFNHLAVQSVLDRHEIWNAEKIATLQLANNPNEFDGLSALLLSVRVLKSLSLVIFNLDKVISLQAALRTFDKMKRLVDRVGSVHTVQVQWASGAYGVKQPISDKALAGACRCVEEFLDTVIAKGCTSLKFVGFDAFASMYKLKKNPAIAATAASTEVLKAPPVVERSSSSSGSIWGSARLGGYLQPSRHARAASSSDVSSSNPLLEESNYCRKSSRFSISSAPWISLAPPSPKLGEVTKLARLRVQSTTVLRPPFSQWLFGLLKASPVIYMALSFEDATDNSVERKLMLDRLAEAVPNVTTIHLVDRARAGVMKDVVAWLGRFQLLESIRIEPECFAAAGNGFNSNGDLEPLQALARLPNIRELVSSSSFICAYLACRCSVGDRGPLARNLHTVIMRHIWKSSTRSAISACLKDVEQLYNAVVEACSEAEKQSLRVRINLCFDCSWFDTAEALGRIWSRIDEAELQKPHIASIDDDEKKLVSPPPQAPPPCFRPPTESTRLWLWLELHITSTEDEIQRGVVDEEVIAFCRMFPTLRKILLCSPVPPAAAPRSKSPLRKERFDRYKTVCPELEDGFVF